MKYLEGNVKLLREKSDIFVRYRYRDIVMLCSYFWKAVTNHSQAASPLGEHSSVLLNYVVMNIKRVSCKVYTVDLTLL